MKKKILKIMLYFIDKMGYKYTIQKETLAHYVKNNLRIIVKMV